MKKLVVYGLAISFAFLSVVPAGADELSKYNAQKKSVSSKLDDISSKKKEVKKAIDQKQNQKQSLLDAQKKKAQEYQQLQKQKDNLSQVTQALDTQLGDAEQHYDDQKELLKKRLKAMYENSGTTYLQTLIESQSLVDFYERIQLLSIITKSDHQLVQDLDEAKKDVEYKKQLKEQELANTDMKAQDKAKAIDDLTVSRAGVEDDLKEYQETLDQLEKQEDELVKQSAAINKELKKLMSKKKYSGGVMIWPSPSCTEITSGYGMRFHPVLKKTKMHTGIDIGAKKGSSIVAAAKGTVIKAGWETGYGNTVVIDHGGGIATLYGHASKILVSVGDTVKAGDTIAKVGSTGWATGPHLHFEVIKDGATTNPLKYVTAN